MRVIGGILNNYLSQAHKADGSLKNSSVTAAHLAPGSVTSASIAGNGGSDGDVLVKDNTKTSGVAWKTVTGSGETGATGATGPQGATGPRGEDGTGLNIAGTVSTAASLPTNLGPSDAGQGYITEDDGHLHIWSGSSWAEAGEVRSPRGATGPTGAGATGATGPARQ